MRVLDPACGSGTFLFHAVRRYLAAAEAKAHALAESWPALTRPCVRHGPASGRRDSGARDLPARDRPRAPQDPSARPIQVPVYLGRSIQWQRAAARPLDRGQSRHPRRRHSASCSRPSCAFRTACSRMRPCSTSSSTNMADRASVEEAGRRRSRRCQRCFNGLRSQRRSRDARCDVQDHVPAARRGSRPHLGLLRSQPGAAVWLARDRESRRCAGRQSALARLPAHDRGDAEGVPAHERRPRTVGRGRGGDAPGPCRRCSWCARSSST